MNVPVRLYEDVLSVEKCNVLTTTFFFLSFPFFFFFMGGGGGGGGGHLGLWKGAL